MAMNPEIKALWLEKLGSGEYTKTEGSLYKREDDTVCHCALGVLAEEAVKAGVLEADENAILYDRFTNNSEFGEPVDNLLPQEVREWAGISDYETEEGRVAWVNDSTSDDDYSKVIDFVTENL